jgi:hypothetical protein
MAGIDTTPSLVATNALQALPFGSIIGAPLQACIEAQAKAAQTTWEFIQAVGLTDTDDGKGKEAIYVNFQFRKNGRSTTLSVPLLTIVPIPYLAIRDISIAFKANISASSSTSQTTHSSLEVGASMTAKASYNLGITKGSMEMKASVSSKKDSTSTRDSKYSVEYTMDVSVKAGQDDIPAGMSKVLEILNESIDTIETSGELTVSEQYLRLGSAKEITTYISYKSPEGYYDSSAINVTPKSGGGALKNEDLTRDDLGVLCKFTKTGTYLVKAGDKEAPIVVVE